MTARQPQANSRNDRSEAKSTPAMSGRGTLRGTVPPDTQSSGTRTAWNIRANASVARAA